MYPLIYRWTEGSSVSDLDLAIMVCVCVCVCARARVCVCVCVCVCKESPNESNICTGSKGQCARVSGHDRLYHEVPRRRSGAHESTNCPIIPRISGDNGGQVRALFVGEHVRYSSTRLGYYTAMLRYFTTTVSLMSAQCRRSIRPSTQKNLRLFPGPTL